MNDPLFPEPSSESIPESDASTLHLPDFSTHTDPDPDTDLAIIQAAGDQRLQEKMQAAEDRAAALLPELESAHQHLLDMYQAELMRSVPLKPEAGSLARTGFQALIHERYLLQLSEDSSSLRIIDRATEAPPRDAATGRELSPQKVIERLAREQRIYGGDVPFNRDISPSRDNALHYDELSRKAVAIKSAKAGKSVTSGNLRLVTVPRPALAPDESALTVSSVSCHPRALKQPNKIAGHIG